MEVWTKFIVSVTYLLLGHIFPLKRHVGFMFTLYEYDGVFKCKVFMLHFVKERFEETILLAFNRSLR